MFLHFCSSRKLKSVRPLIWRLRPAWAPPLATKYVWTDCHSRTGDHPQPSNHTSPHLNNLNIFPRIQRIAVRPPSSWLFCSYLPLCSICSSPAKSTCSYLLGILFNSSIFFSISTSIGLLKPEHFSPLSSCFASSGLILKELRLFFLQRESTLSLLTWIYSAIHCAVSYLYLQLCCFSLRTSSFAGKISKIRGIKNRIALRKNFKISCWIV